MLTPLLIVAGALGDVARPIVLRDVRLSPAADAPRHSILMRDGRIVRIDASDAAAPVDARAIDGQGGLALPAFVDAYSFAGCATPEPKAERDLPAKVSTDVLVDMREANRKGIQPAFRAADVFAPGDALEAWRACGFGALLSAPHGQLLSGQSALAVTRAAAPRDAISRSAVFDHGGFDCTGPGYPRVLMGSISQIRQFLLDARRHAELGARRLAGKPGDRPPFDADLDAAGALLERRRRLCCETQTADDIDRWLKLADEHGFDLAFAGGREAWKRARVLAERKIPVLLTLEWGDEPDDPAGKDAKRKEPKAEDAPWTYREPLASRAEKRRSWLETRDGARVLAEAGVPIAFGTGKDKPKDLLERVRKLVEAGLARDVALRALTEDAAALLGCRSTLGRIAPDLDANVAVWTKDPLADKDAQVAWLFVDGRTHELDVEKKDEDEGKPPAEGLDATGTWAVDFEPAEARDGRVELTMEKDGGVEGRVFGQTPDGALIELAVTGRLSGKELRVRGEAQIGGRKVDVVLEGELEGDTWKGELRGPEPAPVPFRAERKPQEERR